MGLKLYGVIEKMVHDAINEKQDNLLQEGASDILYHFTHIHRFLRILKNNEFNLAIAVGSRYEMKLNKKRFYFLSTTRSKKSGYRTGNVRLTLDGRKLKHNQKIVPVNFYQLDNLSDSEQEDRIISNKSTIPNATDYIKEIHIHYDSTMPKNQVKALREIVNINKKIGIPIYIYKNYFDWLDQTNPMDLDSLEFIDDKYEEDFIDNDIGRFYHDLATLIAYNSEENYKTIIDFLNEKDQSGKAANKFKDTLKHNIRRYYETDSPYVKDNLLRIRTFIHNNRTEPDNVSKFLFDLMAIDMRKLKVQNVFDYLTVKQQVGKESHDAHVKQLMVYINNIIDKLYTETVISKFDYPMTIDGEEFETANESKKLIRLLQLYFDRIRESVKKIGERVNFNEPFYLGDEDFVIRETHILEDDFSKILPNDSKYFINAITNAIYITMNYFDRKYNSLKKSYKKNFKYA